MTCIAAQGDLIALLPASIHTQNADVTHVMMATGIDTTRNFDLDIANGPLNAERLESLAQGRCDGNRASGCERAVVHARAGNQIG